MYKTTVYTLVNDSITHQKQQMSEKRWYYAAWHCQGVNVLPSNAPFFLRCHH